MTILRYIPHREYIYIYEEIIQSDLLFISHDKNINIIQQRVLCFMFEYYTERRDDTAATNIYKI